MDMWLGGVHIRDQRYAQGCFSSNFKVGGFGRVSFIDLGSSSKHIRVCECFKDKLIIS